jgi:hypothetical protein
MTRMAWRLQPDPAVWVHAENLKPYYALGFDLRCTGPPTWPRAAVRAAVQQPESLRNDHLSGRAPVHVASALSYCGSTYDLGVRQVPIRATQKKGTKEP